MVSSQAEDNQCARTIGPERCAACGGEFECGAASLQGCWCSEIKLSKALLENLRERYEHCLCRKCLEQFALRESTQGKSDGEKEKQVFAGQAD